MHDRYTNDTIMWEFRTSDTVRLPFEYINNIAYNTIDSAYEDFL